MENLVLIRHLRRNWDARRTNDPYGLVPNLHLDPRCQLVLLFENLLQLTLHFRPGVIVIQGSQEGSELPRVMFDGVKMVLVLVVARMVLRSALDFFVQFLF